MQTIREPRKALHIFLQQTKPTPTPAEEDVPRQARLSVSTGQRWGACFSGLIEWYPWAIHGLFLGSSRALMEPSPLSSTTTTWCIVDHTRPSSSSYIPSLTFTCHLLLFPVPIPPPSCLCPSALPVAGSFFYLSALPFSSPPLHACPDSLSRSRRLMICFVSPNHL